MPNANTVTLAQINALIDGSRVYDTKIGHKTTVVCLVLPNGFEIVESSGCVDPENYDHEMGLKICRERIVNKVWMLEGYRLQCELWASTPKMDPQAAQ